MDAPRSAEILRLFVGRRNRGQTVGRWGSLLPWMPRVCGLHPDDLPAIPSRTRSSGPVRSAHGTDGTQHETAAPTDRERFDVFLPDTYLIGAPKAGTTSLTRWLESHADMFFCRPKEPHYWAVDYPRMREHRGYATRAAYEALFSSPKARAARHLADGSTTYLYSQNAVPAILRDVPHARFIVALRNPVDLVVSWHRTQLLALNEDEQDFGSAWRRSLAGGVPGTDVLDPKRVDYQLLGRLGQAASRLLQSAPREQVHFVVFEDLVSRPQQVWHAVTDFLDLAAEPAPSFEAHNQSTKMFRSALLHRMKHRPPALVAKPVRVLRQKSQHSTNPAWARVRNVLWRSAPRPTVEDAIRRELTNFFAEDVAALGRLVDRDLSGWSVVTSRD